MDNLPSPAAANFEALFEDAPCGYLCLSADWRVVLVNETFLNWTGYERGAVQARSITDFLDVAGRIYLGTHVMPLLRLQPSFNEVALNFVAADGKVLPFLINASERREAAGDASLILITVFNATDRRQYEAELVSARNELRLANEELERRVEKAVADRMKAELTLVRAQRMEAIGNLGAGIAHDFNNLLQVVGGNLQLLKKHVQSDDGDQRIQNAMRGVHRGARLARQLLAFGGQQLLDPRVCNTARLVRSAPDSLLGTLGHEVALKLEVPDLEGGDIGTALNVHIDSGQFENALLNLAVNARDAMRDPETNIPQGTITVGIHPETVGADGRNGSTFGHVPAGDYVTVFVADTGSGISADVAQNMFEPFFTTKPAGEGTGLGLSMIYGFVTQSEGHITIDSVMGEGTRMSLWLPHVDAPEERAQGAQVEPPVSGNATILVVEDDALLRPVVMELLESLGYIAVAAQDGPEALDLIGRRADIDLMLTDIVMPGGLDGAALAEQTRALRPDLPIVFTTGFADETARVTLADQRGSILRKPYDFDELAEILARNLSATAEKCAASDASRTPVAEQTVPQAKGPDGPAKADLNGAERPVRNVLLVEDETLIRLDMSEMITDLGCNVVDVGDAMSAVTALEGQSFDVLVTDQNLPGMTGVELARHALRAQPHLQIIFVTGDSLIPDLEWDAQVVNKPFTDHDLETALFAQDPRR